jgi:hypothetical protein
VFRARTPGSLARHSRRKLRLPVYIITIIITVQGAFLFNDDDDGVSDDVLIVIYESENDKYGDDKGDVFFFFIIIYYNYFFRVRIAKGLMPIRTCVREVL